MKVSRNRFAIAGVVGALTAAGAIIGGASSFAAGPSHPGTATSSATSANPSSGPGDVPVDVEGVTIRTSPGRCSAASVANRRASMTITVTAAHDFDGGRLVAYVLPRGSETSWRYDVGPAKPGTQTVTATWPGRYSQVMLGVSYQNLGMSHNAGVVNRPHFRVCGASRPGTGSTSQPTSEPPTPSPVTTRLAVTG